MEDKREVEGRKIREFRREIVKRLYLAYVAVFYWLTESLASDPGTLRL